jgi:hypothetical protein
MTIFISFALHSSARLNFDIMSILRTEYSSLFYSLTDEGMNEEFVEETTKGDYQ